MRTQTTRAWSGSAGSLLRQQHISAFGCESRGLHSPFCIASLYITHTSDTTQSFCYHETKDATLP